MKDVLLAIDADEVRALSHVDAVLDLFEDGFRAHVLHVFQENIEGASIANFATARAVEKRLEDEDVEIVLHERSGDPAEEIVDAAEEIDADVVALAGRKRSPAGKLLFGSVSQEVILSTPRSVLMCNAHAEE